MMKRLQSLLSNPTCAATTSSATIERGIGLRRGATKGADGADMRPNKWANGGGMMGRKAGGFLRTSRFWV